MGGVSAPSGTGDPAAGGDGLGRTQPGSSAIRAPTAPNRRARSAVTVDADPASRCCGSTKDEERGRHVPDNGRGRVEFVHRSWPADPAQLSVIRRELAGWLAPLALTDDETAGVVLAVDEAAANAVRHAYGPGRSGVVELTMWTEPGTLCVEVVDHGSWVPPVGDTAPGRPGRRRARHSADELDGRGRADPPRLPRQPGAAPPPGARRAGHGGERARSARTGRRGLTPPPATALRSHSALQEAPERRYGSEVRFFSPGGRSRCRPSRACRRPAGRGRGGPGWASSGRRRGRRSSGPRG